MSRIFFDSSKTSDSLMISLHPEFLLLLSKRRLLDDLLVSTVSPYLFIIFVSKVAEVLPCEQWLRYNDRDSELDKSVGMKQQLSVKRKSSSLESLEVFPLG